MVEKGVSQADLYRTLGVSPSAISDLFSPKKNIKQSRLVPKIHKALGLPDPQAPAPRKGEERERDALLRELIDAWPDLDEDDKELVMKVARRVKPRSG